MPWARPCRFVPPEQSKPRHTGTLVWRGLLYSGDMSKSIIYPYGDSFILVDDQGARHACIPLGNDRHQLPRLVGVGAGPDPTGTVPDVGTGGVDAGGNITITAAMVKAAVEADGGSESACIGGKGYQGIADMFNDVTKFVPGLFASRKRVAIILGECCEETGGFSITTEMGGPFRYDPYRGRGFIQCTWVAEYAMAGKFCADHGMISDPQYFVNNPTALASPQFAAATAAAWFSTHSHNGQTALELCDQISHPWIEISRWINVGNYWATSLTPNGNDRRIKCIDAVYAVTPEATPAGVSTNPGQAQTPVDDYPYKNSAINSVDPWQFYYRECVSFTCWRVRTRHKAKFSTFTNNGGYGGGDHMGNGYEWAQGARQRGIPVDTTPKVGDIACRTTGRAGHVAYVNAVYADGSFDIEEYNHDWSNGYGHIYGKRHLTKANIVPGGGGSNDFQWFIHFGDV